MTSFAHNFGGRVACYLHYKKLAELQERQRQRMKKNVHYEQLPEREREQLYKPEIERISFEKAKEEVLSYRFSPWERLLGYIHVIKGDARRKFKELLLKD